MHRSRVFVEEHFLHFATSQPMRNVSSFITTALAIGALIGTTIYVWVKTRDDEEEKESTKEKTEETKPVEEKKPESNDSGSCLEMK